MRREIVLSLFIGVLTQAPVGADYEPFPIPVRVVNVHSGKCLNVVRSSQDPGAGVIQWPCEGTSNENFRIVYPSTTTTGGFYLKAEHSGQVLNVTGSSRAD